MAITTHTILAASTVETSYTGTTDSAVTFMSLCNTGGAPVLVDVHLVPDGDVTGVDNIFIKDLEIIAGDTYIVYQGGEKILLSINDHVDVVSSLATVTVITSYAGI